MDLYSGSGSWTMISTMPTHTKLPCILKSRPFISLPTTARATILPTTPISSATVVSTSYASAAATTATEPASPLVENLADAFENGTRDQHSDALVSELNNHFEKCQQLLNSIAGSISSRAMTVEGQKRKLEKSEQLLNLRRLCMV